jgi:hypothetical protein
VKERRVLIDRESWPRHLPWVLFAVAATVGASVWYFVEHHLAAGAWPGGSSRPGLTFGILGGLIILFEAFFWVRKKLRAWRIGKTQVWLRAHIWLGLLCVPLLLYHSGFRLGGPLSAVLLILLLVVVASGVWGLLVQQFLPTRLLQDVPAETIYSQIDRVSEQLEDEARRLVLAVCGPSPADALAGTEQRAGYAASGTHLVVGAVRSAGRVQGKVLETRVPAAPLPGSEPLRKFFESTLRPYLLRGEASGVPLDSPTKAAGYFLDLRTHLDPAAHGVVEALEGLCDQRRQFDAQARLQFWLHNWLWVHLPLSAALVLLMFVHVFVALKYW